MRKKGNEYECGFSVHEMQAFLAFFYEKEGLKDENMRVMFAKLLLVLPKEYAWFDVGLLAALQNCISGAFPLSADREDAVVDVPLRMRKVSVFFELGQKKILLPQFKKTYYAPAHEVLMCHFGKTAYFYLFLLVFYPHVRAYMDLKKTKEEAVNGFLSPSLLALLKIKEGSDNHWWLSQSLLYIAGKHIKNEKC